MRRRMNKIMAAMLIGAMTASLALTGCGGKKSVGLGHGLRRNDFGDDAALERTEEGALAGQQGENRQHRPRASRKVCREGKGQKG